MMGLLMPNTSQRVDHCLAADHSWGEIGTDRDDVEAGRSLAGIARYHRDAGRYGLPVTEIPTWLLC